MGERFLTPLFQNLIIERRTADEEEIRAYFRRLEDGPETDSPEQRALEAEEDRRVELVLEATGSVVAEVLKVCLFNEVPLELRVYGLLAHLVTRSPEASAAHEMSGTDLDLTSWLCRLPRRAQVDPPAKWLLEILVSEATRQFVDAMLSYRDAKRRLGFGRR